MLNTRILDNQCHDKFTTTCSVKKQNTIKATVSVKRKVYNYNNI